MRRYVYVYVYIPTSKGYCCSCFVGFDFCLEMSRKRPQRDEATAGDDKFSRKSPSLRSVAVDVMNLQRLQHLINPVLEPLVRRVVKEEVDSALKKYVVSIRRNCAQDACLPEMRRLQLQFVNALSLPVFTGTRIEGDGCSALEIALVDVLSGDVVSSGVESSARVEIVVLEGDFDGDDGDNWMPEKFTNYIVREREGKKPLLTGDLILTLKDGTGAVGDLSFTDNSSWTRSRKFRLGARVMDDVGIRIREAKSEPFIVRDHRGELYKKHHPPYLSDEVWRLEKIGKDGALHKRLNKEGVKTVQDFLLLHSLNPTRLRNILGSSMSSKKWEATVEHARTCVLRKTLYMYDHPSTSLQKGGVVFNIVGQVTGVFCNGEYVLADKLSESNKAEAQELVISAFGNRDKIMTLDESALRIHAAASSGTSLDQPHSPNLLSEDSELQGSTCQKMSASRFSELDAMHSFYSTGCSTSYDYGLNNVVGIQCDEPLSFSAQAGFCAGEQFDYIEEECLLQPGTQFSSDLYSAVSSFTPCPSDTARKGWSVLACVLRWRSSIKRIVARKSSRVRAMT